MLFCAEWFGLVFGCWVFSVCNMLGGIGTLNYVPKSGILPVVPGHCLSLTLVKLRPLQETWVVHWTSAKCEHWEGSC